MFTGNGDDTQGRFPAAGDISIGRMLDTKNFKLFTRNTDRIKTEFFVCVELIAIMALVGYLVRNGVVTMEVGPAPAPQIISNDQTMTLGCYLGGIAAPPCYTFFADPISTEGTANAPSRTGCSSQMNSFLDKAKVCSGPTTLAAQEALFEKQGKLSPICACGSLDQFTNTTWAETTGVTAAFGFDAKLSGSYTIFIGPQNIDQTDITKSNLQKFTDVSFEAVSAPVFWQMAIDSAFLGTDLNVEMQYFPQQAYQQVSAGSFSFVSFYIVMLVMYSLVAIASELCKENADGLRHGLFMNGLRVSDYYFSWFRVICIRMLITLVPLTVILKFLIFTHMNMGLMLLGLLGFAIWAAMFCIFCSLTNVKPNQVGIFLLLLPIVSSMLVYFYIPKLSSSMFPLLIPEWGTYLMAIALPPFACAQYFAIAVWFESNSTVMDFTNFTDKSILDCNALGVLLCLYAGIFIIAMANIYLAKSTTGIARKKKKSSDNVHHDTSTHVSIEDAGSSGSNEAIVQVRGLVKHFTTKEGNTTRAVDGMTVDFYKNQITSFLGHNGAGKSTTISLLTGLFNTDEGDAFIKGHSIVTDMKNVRKYLGVCPQNNVLWELLTCREHLEVYARIRGMAKLQSEAEGTQLLKEIGLFDKADTFSKQLSGGQKRKLQTACALIGDPEVVFLDEPTAGMDSSARRDLWELLLKKKEGRTIILCTHQMDEADILGDRVVVVSSGKIQAEGTPALLKIKYGRGTCVDIATSKGANRRQIIEFVRSNGGENTEVDLSEYSENPKERELALNDVLDTTASGDLHLIVPNDDTTDIGRILTALETKPYGIEDFGINATTLEDVFWELGRQAQEEAGVKHDTSLPVDVKFDQPQKWTTLIVLLRGHWLRFKRTLTTRLSENLFPLLLIAGGTFLLSFKFNFGGDSKGFTLNMTENAFANVPTPTTPWDGSTQPATNFINSLGKVGTATILSANGVSPCLSSWLVDSTDPKLCPVPPATFVAPDPSLNPPTATNAEYVGAFEFAYGPPATSEDPTKYKIFNNASISYGVYGMVSLGNNALLKAANSEIKLSMSMYQWPAQSTSASTFTDAVLGNVVASGFGAMIFCVGMIYLGAKIVISVVDDRVAHIKQMQVLMGVSRLDYYVARVIFDAMHFFSVMIVPIIVIVAVSSSVSSPALILLLILYFLAIIPLIYLISEFFNESVAAFSTCTLLGIVTFSALSIIYTSYVGINISDSDDKKALANGLYYSFLLHPIFALQQGLIAITWSNTGIGYNALLYDDQNIGYGIYFQTAAWPCIYLAIEAILFNFLAIHVEYRRSGNGFVTRLTRCLVQYCMRCVCLDKCYDNKPADYKPLADDDDYEEVINSMTAEEVEDADVKQEKMDCDCSIMRSNSIEMTNQGDETTDKPLPPALLCKNVRMEYDPSGKQRYKGTVAVKDFSLRIRNKECFSLLGSNGAGKTTMMSVMLKQIEAKSGAVSIRGEDIWTMSTENSSTVSYCPQANAMFDTFTTRECLAFYCNIRGVPKDQLDQYLDQWESACDLKAHTGTFCKDLSGGNKRKLSLAISLIGGPSFIVLDEPSAGVDPAARRKLHRLINATKRRGATIVLTTHHMDEAAILGDRVGIMVKGYLTCLGSVQHLIRKYCHGYLLTVCMKPKSTVNADLLPALRKECPNAHIKQASGEEYAQISLSGDQTLIREAGSTSTNLSVAAVYKLMLRLQEEGSLDYFTLGQSRLEDVFLMITDRFTKKKQQDVTAAGAGAVTQEGIAVGTDANPIESGIQSPIHQQSSHNNI